MTHMPALSRGSSRDSEFISSSLVGKRSGEARLHRNTHFAEASPSEEKLYSALSAMKIFTSQVAMHMDRSWRDTLFGQLDRLHDPAQWDESDDPVEIASFRTFLRLMFLLKPNRHPGLALANNGHLLAHWISNKDRLTIECLRDDKVKIVFTRWFGDEPDRGAILTNIDRVHSFLASYDPSCWFAKP